MVVLTCRLSLKEVQNVGLQYLKIRLSDCPFEDFVLAAKIPFQIEEDNLRDLFSNKISL